MSERKCYEERLAEIEWDEGRIERFLVGSYRHEVIIHCSDKGRRKGNFANGEFPYFAYVDLLGGDGKWIERGTHVVPVLPDGRILVVMEERAPLARYVRNSKIERPNGELIVELGPCGDIEFPGGAIKPGESFTS